MLPKYLKLRGFRSYIDETIDFTQFSGISCISGENGNGKSSILEGITTCLFWRNACTDNKGAGMDNVINANCDEMELEFAFSMNDNDYIINTKKKRGDSRTLDFYIGGISQGEKVTETQAKIDSVIKMNYDSFLDTVCISQGQASRFMDKKPAERKETLTQILDIKKYEDYEEIAKEKKKELKKQIDLLNTKIEMLSEGDFNLQETKSNINALQNEVKKLTLQQEVVNNDLEKVLTEKNNYLTLKKQREYILNARNKLNNEVNNLKNKISVYQDKINNTAIDTTNYKEEIAQLDDTIEKVRDKLTALKEKISSLKTEKQLKEKTISKWETKIYNLKNYDKGECELCGSQITAEHKQAHLSQWQQEIDKINQDIEQLSISINKLNENGKIGTQKGKELSTHRSELIQKQSDAQTTQIKVNDWKENVINYQEELKDKQEQYENNLQMEVVELEEKIFNDQELRDKLSDIQNSISKNNSQIAIWESNIQKWIQQQEEIEKLTTQVSNIKEEYSDYNALATAFGKNGIPAQIIEHDIPELEQEVNNILSILSNNSLSLNFITSKKKDKKSMDTFDIIINDSFGSRNYETYSGGERFRVDFACHIGLSKFLTKRSGATIDFLMIDEGLGSQDDTAKQKFIDSINALKSVFKQIMVITHIQDIQNAFEHKVLVQKDQIKGSYIEVN